MAAFPLRGVVLAVAGAALGSVLWVLIAIAANLESSYPAILVGVFAGTFPRIEPRRGRAVQVAALLATLVGLTIVQYFVVRHAIINDRVALGLNRSAPTLLAPAAMVDVTFSWLRVYPLNLLAWVVSAAAALFLPAGGSSELPSSPAFPATEADAA